MSITDLTSTRVLLHYPPNRPPVSLTWSDVDRLFGPEPAVAFDRDIAAQGWPATLATRPVRERVMPAIIAPEEIPLELWAEDYACAVTGWHVIGRGCRCVFWSGVRWVTRIEEVDRLRAELERKRQDGIGWVDENTHARFSLLVRAPPDKDAQSSGETVGIGTYRLLDR